MAKHAPSWFMVPSNVASHPGHEVAKQQQTITLSSPCQTVGVMTIEQSHKNLGNHPLCCFWSAVLHSLELCHGCNLCPVFSSLLSHETLTLTEVREAGSSLNQRSSPTRPRPITALRGHLVQDCTAWGPLLQLLPFATSWMSHQSALGVISIGWPFLRKFTTVPYFLNLWIMALTMICWSPKALGITL